MDKQASFVGFEEHVLLSGTALEELMRDRTTIIIAHRLSTIQHADQIAVMENGTIVEIGDHQSLMQNCDLYQRLVELQFKHMPTQTN